MVRGLAWRWLAETVGEERLQGAGDQRHDLTAAAQSLAGGGAGQQLGDRGQVPVGRARFAVAEVGRQRRDLGLHVLTGPVPAQQGPDGEGVAEVVQPGPPRRVGSDAAGVDDVAECLRDHRVAQPVPGAGGEEASAAAPSAAARREGGRSRPGPARVDSVTGTSRDLPNFDSRISSTPVDQSMSARSSLIASPIRSPVAASRPIRVT